MKLSVPLPASCLKAGYPPMIGKDRNSGGAQSFICGTTGCHEETDGGYYCLECAAAYQELREDLEWIDKQGPVVDIVTDKLSCSSCRGEAAAAPAPKL